MRDFDLLDNKDWFGTTVTGYSDWIAENEPKTADISERYESLRRAKDRGINTWISYEPVFSPKLFIMVFILTLLIHTRLEC